MRSSKLFSLTAVLVLAALLLCSCAVSPDESSDISSAPESSESSEASESESADGEQSASDPDTPAEEGSAAPVENPFENCKFVATQIGLIEPVGEHFVIQGGCVYDGCSYQAVTNDKYNSCVIVKYSLDPWEVVACSEPIDLGHANDVTYRPDTDELYVVSLKQENKQIVILDAATLTLKEQKRLGGMVGCYAIDFNVMHNQFVTGTGETSMGFYTPDLEFVSLNLARPENFNLVTQSICTDEDYIYHVLYKGANVKGTKNEVFIYDWDGNFITRLFVGIPSIEPENIGIDDGVFYVGCNNSNWTGGEMYRVELTERE